MKVGPETNKSKSTYVISNLVHLNNLFVLLWGISQVRFQKLLGIDSLFNLVILFIQGEPFYGLAYYTIQFSLW